MDSVLPASLRPSVERLLEAKRRTGELGFGPKVQEINHFVEEEFERHGQAFSGQGRPDVLERDAVHEELNAIFRAAVRAAP
jgi:predicted nucleotidyltransferase